jgi:uncharacterized protein YdhG (YjbR/CyaY superfamily)
MATKVTYKHASKKKQVREFLFSFFNQKNIVGLAGPDVEDYISWCKDHGMENIEMWENDHNVMIHQLMNMPKDAKAVYKFGDIMNANSNEDTLYDLDYCTTVVSVHKHLARFKNEKFIMTFCIRKVGEDKTIEEFFYGRREKIISSVEKSSPMNHKVIKTIFGEYITVTYFDTTPMMCIAKIK